MPTYFPNWPAASDIANNTPVDEAVTNVPIDALQERTEQLREAIETYRLGEVVLARGVPLDPLVEVGDAVYYDDVLLVYAQAYIEPSDITRRKSYVEGIVLEKSSTTVGTIVLYGTVRAPVISLVSASMSGCLYASTTPGALTDTRSDGAPFVCNYHKDIDTATVSPDLPAGAELHIHKRLELVASPAGTPNEAAEGFKHEIETPDDTLPGWLPADHAVFGGAAPVGAKFGYNLDQDATVAAEFPLAFPSGAGIEVYGGRWGTTREPDVAVQVTSTGIWWMLDDYGWAPWTVDYWEILGSSGVPGADPAEAPTPVDVSVWDTFGATYPLSIYLLLTKPAGNSPVNGVSTLVAASGSPLSILDEYGREADTGNLIIDVDLGLATEEGGVDDGASVVGAEGSSLYTRQQVASIKSVNSALVVSGAVDDAGAYRGLVTLDFNDPNSAGRRLAPELVELDGARQGVQQGILYLELPEGRSSGLRMRFDVPVGGFSAGVDYEITLQCRVLATVAGTLPDLAITARKFPTSETLVAAPTVDTESASLTLSTNTATTLSYVDVESTAFDVDEGDTVFMSLSRTASDGYTGGVGFISVVAVITPK